MSKNEIPYKIYLNENEMPKFWYNLRADMKNKPAPLLNPGTHQTWSNRNWTTTPASTRCPRRFWISTRCTAPLPWSGPTVWKRS